MDIMSGLLACLPIIVLIVGALATKKMSEMIVVASILAAILQFGTGAFTGYLDMLYGVLSDDTFQLILIILLGFGAMTTLFEKSGGIGGFAALIGKFANTRKKSMVATWVMSVCLFIDDYLNVLSTSFAMRSLTDAQRVPREHLGYAVNSVGACICVLVPITSWAAFGMQVGGDYGVNFNVYLAAIPLMFFPIASLLMNLLVSLGVVPKVGLIKKAYERVDAGGPLVVKEEGSASLVKVEEDPEPVDPSSPWNFFLPIIVLIIVSVIMDNSIAYGIIAGLIAQLIMYAAQKRITVSEGFELMFEGFGGMAGIAFAICFAYMTVQSCLDMGMATFLIDLFVTTVPAWALPTLIFLITGLVSLTADSWVVTVLAVPIFLPLAIEMGVPLNVAMAAVMSAVAFGSQYCLFADAVFMSSASTGLTNVTLIKVVTPYVMTCVAIATVGFLVTGVVVM